MAKLNPKHALTDSEVAFCVKLAAMGGPKNHDFLREAYRLALYPQVFVEGRFREPDDMPDPDQLLADAREMWDKETVKSFYRTLDADSGAVAREVIHEQALVGDEKQRAKAAEQILKMEDKHGLRDAAQDHLELLCSLGTEVVVDVPGGGEVSFPLGQMFPKFSESTPPRAAVEKSIAALERYLEERPENDTDDNGHVG